jgi:four helix bundle protein
MVGDRVLAIAAELERTRVFRRVVDQVVGSGTGVGANLFEADEAVSTKDWVKCVGVVLKELNEARYWLRRIARQGWIRDSRLSGVSQECDDLRKVLGFMVVRTKHRLRTQPR